MNFIGIIYGVGQLFLLAASEFLAYKSLGSAYDTVTVYRSDKKERLGAFAYAVLAIGTGRLAVEGLIGSWYYWVPLIKMLFA